MASISFDITATNRDFLEKMQGIQGSVSKTSKLCQEASKYVGAFTGSFETLEEAQSALDGLRTRIDKLDVEIEKTSQAMENCMSTSKVEEYRESLGRLVNISSTLGEIYDDLSRAVSDFAEQGKSSSESVAEVVDDVAEVADSADDLAVVSEELDKVSEEMQEVSESSERAGTSVAGMKKDFTSLQDAQKYATQIRKEINVLEAQINNTRRTMEAFASNGDSEGAERYQYILENLVEKSAQLGEELKRAQEYMDSFNKSASKDDKKTEKMQSFRAQMRMANEELRKLTDEYLAMSEAEQASEKGMAMASRIDELVKKIGKCRDMMGDLNRQIKYNASDTSTFDALSEGADTAVSAIGGLIAATGLLNDNEEEYEMLQTKLQSVLTISNALKTIQNNLQKESSLMMGVNSVQTSANTLAVSLNTAAESSNVAVRWAAVAAQKALNLVSSANPYVLLGTALLTVVGALALYVKGEKEAKERAEATKKAQEELRKEHEHYAEVMSSKTGDIVSHFMILQKQYKALRTEGQKTEWINANQSAFHGMGLSITDVNSANRAFITQAPAVISALKAIAEASAYEELYKESIINKEKNWTERSKSTKTGDYYNKVGAGYNAYDLTAEERRAMAQAYVNGNRAKTTNDNGTLTKAGADIVNQYRRNEALKKRNQYESDYNKTIKERGDALDNAQKKALNAQSALQGMGLGYSGDDKTKGSQKGNSGKTDDTAQKQLEEREKLNKELADLVQDNVDEEIKINKKGNEQELAEIENDYKKRVAKLEEQKADWIKRNKESNMSGLLTEGTDKGLTQDQANALNEALKLAQDERNKSLSETKKQELQYMLDYLKEYGNMQEQRYAIAKEYDDKIAQLQSEGANEYQIKVVQRQKETALSQNYEQDLLSRIDFATAFDKFGTAFKEPLEQIRKELEDYTKTSSFKSKDVKEQESIINALNQVEEKLGGSLDGLKFKKVGNDIDAYSKALVRQNNAIAEQAVAYENLKRATDNYQKALKSGDKAEIESTKVKVQEAQVLLNNANNQVVIANQQAQTTQATLTDSSSKLEKSLKSVQTMAQGLASGSALQLWNSMPEEITNKATDAISKALGGKSDIWSMIISTILSLLETLHDGIGQLVNAIVSSVGDAVQGILDDIGSGEFFAQIGEAVYNLITSIVEGVLDLFSGGQFKNINWSGSNEKEVAKITEDNTKAIQLNTDRVDALKDSIDKQTGAQAVSTAQSAVIAQEDTNKRVMEILEAQMGYHSAHHSNNYYADNDEVSKLYNESVQNAIKAGVEMQKSINGIDDIYTMTPEQIAAIKTYMPALWEYLTTVGKYDKSEYWEDVVDQAGKLEEITEQVKENLTGMTFDNLKDSFKTTLMDMDSSVDDFADDLTEKMTDAFLNIKLGEEGGLYDKLEEWYNDYYEKLKDGELTDEEIADAQSKYQELVQEGIDTRNKIAELTGYYSNSNQEATANGITSITADQADQLVSRLTAIQIAVSQSRDTNLDLATEISNGVAQIISIGTGMTSANKALTDILYQMQTANGYLYDISDRNNKMYQEWGNKLDNISSTLKDKL